MNRKEYIRALEQENEMLRRQVDSVRTTSAQRGMLYGFLWAVAIGLVVALYSN